ncbi:MULTISPECIES: VanZ family protein [Psychrilyobacter]|uniref:VanZ family protein n=1 Tax=Psychrilyobacter piezotolerans TaxID=2293438 RepID=A0ABX9KDG5_9FUSO|nr:MULTISPECIES: VanZ family protein [Psychrilyobacter]MCS5422937.1 VanZ family protein [Psychrilyobacter sp. S5]NDI79161.1 VanZ family protein [Psychrilyobacter piezotolerans]RDE58927.1 VanZ family protein [Psychrilyobacter sp. S5]REI39478.1 VanZ family protein [Psychrilyobacter piezotolerans]
MKRETTGKIILIIVFITAFWFSSKPANESAGQSGKVLVKMKLITKEDAALKTKKYLILSRSIRKAAHFSLYFTAGIGAFLATGSLKKSILIVFVMGGIDEFHQYFVPGRGAQFTDVLIDTLGGTAGAAAVKLAIGKKINK